MSFDAIVSKRFTLMNNDDEYMYVFIMLECYDAK